MRWPRRSCTCDGPTTWDRFASSGILQRHHDIETSDATVYRVCKGHGLNRLPNRVGRRAVHTHRYQKQVPGHHVQVDVNSVVKKFPFRIRTIRSDRGHEFYQLLTYRDDVDLQKKLAAWEKFYNYDRPHGAHKGKTPYEVLREKLS